MAVVKPFAGWHYNQEKFSELEKIIAPPYDVISEKELARMKAESKYNYTNIILPEGEDKHSRSAELFKLWQKEKILVKDSKPTLYFYRQTFSLTPLELFCQNVSDERISRVSLFCVVGLEEYSSRIILPHEKTFSGPKADRYKLMDTTQGNMEPVFLGYDSPRFAGDEFSKIILTLKPNFSYTDDANVLHEVWSITDSKVHLAVEKVLGPLKFYILDGHHRYETALKYYLEHQKSDAKAGHRYVLAAICSFRQPGAIILPTHRALRNGDAAKAKNLLTERGWTWNHASTLSELEKNLKESKSTAFGIKLKDIKGYGFLKSPSPRTRLDLEVLHEDVLSFFAEDPKLEYIKDISELESKVDEGLFIAGFLLKPSTTDEVMAVAEKNSVMPHKSTFFYPKIPSGLVINTFN
jgi:uncharacterized protein (DUF1015 family)